MRHIKSRKREIYLQCHHLHQWDWIRRKARFTDNWEIHTKGTHFYLFKAVSYRLIQNLNREEWRLKPLPGTNLVLGILLAQMWGYYRKTGHVVQPCTDFKAKNQQRRSLSDRRKAVLMEAKSITGISLVCIEREPVIEKRALTKRIWVHLIKSIFKSLT